MSHLNRNATTSPDDALVLLTSERFRGHARALCAIFLGVCVVFLAVMLTLSADRADRTLLDAAELFAGSIPLLATAFLLSISHRAGILGLIFFAAGALTSTVALALALAHIDMTASAIFLISIVASVFIVFVVDTLTRFTYTATEQPDAKQPAPVSKDTASADYVEAP
jgi:hypothetical protein